MTGISESEDMRGDFATVAYSLKSGREMWTSRFDGPGVSAEQPTSIAMNGSARIVYVAGYGETASVAADYVTIAYDAVTGSRLWKRRYDGSVGGIDVATSVAVGPGGAIAYVTGVSEEASPDFVTFAYDATTGAIEWTARYDGPDGDRDTSGSVIVSPDGASVYATGTSTGIGTSADFATVAYAA